MWPLTNFPSFIQMDQMDCGPTCLCILSKHYKRPCTISNIRKLCDLQKDGVSIKSLVQASSHLGFNALPIHASLEELLNEVPLPAIAHVDDNHFTVVYKVSKRKIYLSDPEIGLTSYPIKEFLKRWSSEGQGILILTEPKLNFKNYVSEKESSKGLLFLLPYLSRLKRYYRPLFLAMVVMAMIQLIIPFLTQSLVDLGIEKNNINFIRVILLAQITLTLSLLFTDVLRQWLLIHLSMRVNISLISDYLGKLLKTPFSFFQTKTTGDFLQRIYDNIRVDDFLNSRLLALPFDLLSILVFAAILGYFNTTILAIFSIGTLGAMGWSLLFFNRKERLDRRLFKINKKEQTILVQLIHAIKEIKLNGSEKRRSGEWKSLQKELYSIQMRVLKADLFQIKGSGLVNNIMNTLIIFWSALDVVSGTMTLGSLLAIQFIIAALVQPSQNVLNFLVDYQKANLSIARLAEIRFQKPEVNNTEYEPIAELADIQLSNVDFCYDKNDGNNNLENISITLPKGQITAIVGKSGSGKTTLLNLLMKLYLPGKGTIYIGDRNLWYLKADSWRRQCGCVLQDGYLFNDTIENNITESSSSKAMDSEWLLRCLTICQLATLIDHMPQGLQTKVGENGSKLSGGERQRILLARALYKKPNYLFFDEATSALDAENENNILNGIIPHFKNRTVLLIAHRLSTIKMADHIVVLNDGKAVECGNHQDLLKNKSHYYNLVKHQI